MEKIHSPSTNAFGTLVNEENGCIYVESYTNLGFENYGVIEINYSYDMYALTGSINSGIINGTGNLVVDSVTFTNNGVINSQTLFYNSLINIGPNFTILNDEVVFRGCEILFTESPVNISTVTYRQTTKCVEAIPSIQTNIIGVTLEEQQLDISATIIRIETSDLGTNSYSFNNCDISITDSTISTLQLTNETNIQIVNSEIQYLIATNCVINNELLVRTLRATNSTFNIVELVTGYLINSTFESIKNTQEAIICNNDTSSSSPFQYIIIKELINEASIIFNGYFQFENIVLGSEDHLHSFSINPGIAPTILVDCYVYDVTLNSVYTYGSTYFNGTIVSIITNYGELELLSLPGSIDSLILKSGSTLYSSDSFELSNMHIESMVTTSVNRCVISSSLYFEGDIDLTTLILLDGSTVTSSLSTDVLYVDTIVATDTTSIAVGIEVSNQCSNLVLSSKYLTTTESFNGYCTTSTITTLNNYGTYQHNGAISIVNNYGTYVVSSDCSSFMLNYGTLQLNDGIVGQSLFVGCGNGSVIRGSGIAGLSSQETDIETQVFVYVDGEIEITNNYDNDLIITANVYEDRNDILYVDYSTNNLFDTIVILDDFTPPEPTNYTVFVIEELSFTPNIKIRIYDYESNYPWTTGYTSTYAYVEYLGCPEVYNPLTKFCESCPTGYIFNEETKQCSDCPIGKVMTDGICVNCSAGTYEYSGTCIQCGEKEVSSEGSTECITCTSGTIPDSNKTNCVYCDAGTELIDNDIYYGCKPCSAGYYKSESQTSQRYCLPCEVGHYNPYKGQVSCFPCTPGFYQNLTGQSSCSKCPSGYAQNEFKSTECFMCENDEFANNEQSDCILCDAGFEEYQGSCYWCKPGTYKNDTGKYCEVCPDGTYQPYKGRTSCYECPDGKHVKNNATICVDDEMETNIPAMVAIYTIFPIAIAMACCSVFCCAFYENRKDKKEEVPSHSKDSRETHKKNDKNQTNRRLEKRVRRCKNKKTINQSLRRRNDV
ncbi:Tyrosine-protein kinase ephrin type A/B receptor-like domain-containing protein [Entamoeba marina]